VFCWNLLSSQVLCHPLVVGSNNFHVFSEKMTVNDLSGWGSSVSSCWTRLGFLFSLSIASAFPIIKTASLSLPQSKLLSFEEKGVGRNGPTSREFCGRRETTPSPTLAFLDLVTFNSCWRICQVSAEEES